MDCDLWARFLVLTLLGHVGLILGWWLALRWEERRAHALFAEHEQEMDAFWMDLNEKIAGLNRCTCGGVIPSPARGEEAGGS